MHVRLYAPDFVGMSCTWSRGTFAFDRSGFAELDIDSDVGKDREAIVELQSHGWTPITITNGKFLAPDPELAVAPVVDEPKVDSLTKPLTPVKPKK